MVFSLALERTIDSKRSRSGAPARADSRKSGRVLLIRITLSEPHITGRIPDMGQFRRTAPRSLPAQGFRSPPRVILSVQNAFSCARPLVICSSPEPV
ncbi:hypothetical protein [Burkholderia plantarii]|uniref:hypothetical protein n=1 Tax=Burkholderia plantarii TaxID=41899 RepID=UPI0018DD382E|nr:hypothetical protein [Burkholderia plantarii]